MAALLSENLFWAFAAVQVVGLLSAASTRFAESRSAQASLQGLFLATMSLVAMVTVASIVMGWTTWVLSGATLSMMVVMAVWEPGLRTAS